jgi:hypothetical protein
MRAVELEGEVHNAFRETEEQITDVPGISMRLILSVEKQRAVPAC